jgi:hypothetical protein
VYKCAQGHVRVSRLDLFVDYATSWVRVGLDWPGAKYRTVARNSERHDGQVVRQGYLRFGPERHPLLVSYQKGRRHLRVERRLLPRDLFLDQLAILPSPFAKLQLFDLAPRGLPQGPVREAVLRCANDLERLAQLAPDLLPVVRVDHDPHHPDAVFCARWPQVVSALAVRLGVDPSVFGHAAAPTRSPTPRRARQEVSA